MKELYPGIYQITLTLEQFPPGSVNIYLIRDANGYAVIDTGLDLPAPVDSLRKEMAESGILFSEIKKVLITHYHSDHLGLMGRLKKENRAEVYLHSLEIEIMRIRYDTDDSFWRNTDAFIQQHGIPESELRQSDFVFPSPGELIAPDHILNGGEKIRIGQYTLEIIHTPGHTPGHICLYEPVNRLLFSGDTLLADIATNAATHVQQMTNPVQQYLDSLSRLRGLEITMVLPGHGRTFSDYRKRIAQMFDHYHQKCLMIMNTFKTQQASLTAYQLARILPWTPGNKKTDWTNLGSRDKRLAMLQTIALMEQLTFAGELIKLEVNGKICYKPRKPA
jgi:glyoxylase-like metal-dependent hydrolase (beta-lactamase superfamily II)